MSFLEKLPLTTFAIGIAAAFQAASTTSSLWTATAWCLVIAATAGEVTFRFWKESQWKRWPKRVTALAGIGAATLVISLAMLQAYRKVSLTDDARLTFKVPHPNLGPTGSI